MRSMIAVHWSFSISPLPHSPPLILQDFSTHHGGARQGSVKLRRCGHVDHGGNHCCVLELKRERRRFRIFFFRFFFLEGEKKRKNDGNGRESWSNVFLFFSYIFYTRQLYWCPRDTPHGSAAASSAGSSRSGGIAAQGIIAAAVAAAAAAAEAVPLLVLPPPPPPSAPKKPPPPPPPPPASSSSSPLPLLLAFSP